MKGIPVITCIILMLLFAYNIVIINNLIFFVYLSNIIMFITNAVGIIVSIIPFVSTLLVFIVLFIIILISVLLVIITTVILFSHHGYWRHDVKPSYVITFNTYKCVVNYVTALFNDFCKQTSDCQIVNGRCWHSKECGWSVCACEENYVMVAKDKCIPGNSTRS